MRQLERARRLGWQDAVGTAPLAALLGPMDHLRRDLDPALLGEIRRHALAGIGRRRQQGAAMAVDAMAIGGMAVTVGARTRRCFHRREAPFVYRDRVDGRLALFSRQKIGAAG
jgi:hypothetical protein